MDPAAPVGDCAYVHRRHFLPLGNQRPFTRAYGVEPFLDAEAGATGGDGRLHRGAVTVRWQMPLGKDAPVSIDYSVTVVGSIFVHHADIAGFEPASPGLTVQCSTN